MKHIQTFESFINEAKDLKVKFDTENSKDKNSAIHELGDDELTDEETGLTFSGGEYKVAYVKIVDGHFKNWSFAIFSNNKEVMVHGNPIDGNKMGEVFSVTKGSMKDAEKIANHLFATGELLDI
jgi:hypothetical protein